MRTRDSQGGRGRGPRRPAKDGKPPQGRPKGERRSPSPAQRGRAGEGAPRAVERKGPPTWWNMPAVPDIADTEPDVPTPALPPRSPARTTAPPPRPQPAPPPGTRLAGVQELEVRVEKLVAGGEGLARWEGVPIFVPRSAPGDLLKVRIVERRPDYGRGEIVEILEAGPARRPDPFPELSPTGICDLQHIRDEVQPLLKAAAVRETLERLGGIQVGPGNTQLIAGAPWGYRLRTQLHSDVDPMTNGVRIGYYARGTKTLVPVTRCPL
ncbi:MAG TPA: TRAM domain-containing protein, partial [Thermoanaerobaculia bacterium]